MAPGTTHLGSDFTRVIELHLRNCELVRKAGPGAAPPAVQPFVALSRQVAAGGGEIAAELARRLNWPLFDREILRAMARDNDVRERLYAWMDERDTTWLEQVLESLQAGRFPPQDYFQKMCDTVLVLARSGPGVFLGRGADRILPAECGLRVRVVAPLEQRVKRMALRNQLREADARSELLRIDRERADFVRHHFHCDADDPLRSALTLNTAQVSVSEAVEMVMTLLHTRGLAQ